MLGHTLLLGPLGTEEKMKRQWHIRRETVNDRTPRSLGSSVPVPPAVEPRKRAGLRSRPSAYGKEEYHEGGGLRSGLDL